MEGQTNGAARFCRAPPQRSRLGSHPGRRGSPQHHLLAGVHSGCFELFGTERVRAIRDLKGKTVAVLGLGEAEHVFVSSMLAHVGLDPRKDVRWVASPPVDSIHRLAEGSVDAYLAFPPFAQELRARKIGHVVTNSTVDRPWSQYFCCMVVGRSEFVRKHPVATKRAIRAVTWAAAGLSECSS